MFVVGRRLVYSRSICVRSVTTDILRIGSVTRPVSSPIGNDRSLVPVLYYEKNLIPPSFVRHLEWLMKKDQLGQDALLVGAPGPTRRRLILAYLELTRKPYQYLQLTRDTTDSDIKQRREISDKTARFINQAAVNAAIHGHTLVLDGLEKTERNVLPILNNLLENREMNLDNGQFLVSTQRFDALLKSYTQEQLDQLNFIRVNENFRVIALTLPPVAAYKGHSLDPPLRSRFQLRDIDNEPLTYAEHTRLLKSLCPNVETQLIENLLSLASLINSTDLETLKLTRFPLDRLDLSVSLAEFIPTLSIVDIFHRIYPFHILYAQSKESQQAIENMYKQLSIKYHSEMKSSRIIEINPKGTLATVDYEMNGKQFQIKVPAHDPSIPVVSPTFISTSYHEQLLVDLMLSHAIGDICLIGPKGCGKSLIIDQFGSLLNYPIEYFVLYKDLSARELLQQRMTNERGDTLWQNTPLVEAALHGRLLVLDGIHRLNGDTLVSLQRLVQDREIFLPDGTRLLRHDRYDRLENPAKNIRRIHPSFRVIALAEPPGGTSNSAENSSVNNEQNWLNAETLNLFLFHQMRSLNLNEERQIVYSSIGTSGTIPAIEHLLKFVHELRNSNETQLKTVARSLSTRNVLRIAKHLNQITTTNYHAQLRDQLIRQTSAPFLPRLVQDAFLEILDKSGLNSASEQMHAIILSKSDWKQSKRMSENDTEQSAFEHAAKVPFTIFYENPIHTEIIQQMHESFTLGEHLLLIGPQGVAKNRIVDHYLQTLKLPREYIQLHRDTTVQSLTIQANVIDGRIVYEDSPLIKAIKEGSVAVIDEADKAPTSVTGILKSLIESGSMFLSDGRRVYPKQTFGTAPSNMIIRTHPNFRMIVLANRPGFPFLGNDFFLSLGDHFSTFPILNPPRNSEIILLANFAPNVSREKLEQLVDVFTELRQLSTDGIISYPYSLRELVSIVKHLNSFPNDSLADVVRNVFDLDNYNTDVIDRIRSILHRHGIPFHVKHRTVNLVNSHPLRLVPIRETWPLSISTATIEHTSPLILSDKSNEQIIKRIESIGRSDSRTETFSEMMHHYRLPLDETTYVHDLKILQDNKTVLVLTGNPLSLWTFKLGENQAKKIDLNSIFSMNTNRFNTPNYQLCLIPNNINQVLIGDLTNQSWALVDVQNGASSLVQSSQFPQTIARKLNEMLTQRTTSPSRSMYNSHLGQLLQFASNNDSIRVIDFVKNISQLIKLPFTVRHAVPFGDRWLLSDNSPQSASSYLFDTSNEQTPVVSLVEYNLDKLGLGNSGGYLNENSLWFSSSQDYLARTTIDPNANLQIERFQRSKSISSGDVPPQEMYEKRRLQTFINKQHSLVASFYAKNEIEKKFTVQNETSDGNVLSYIELVDLNRHLITYIPILRPQQTSRSSGSQHEWHMLTKSGSGVIAAQCNDGSLLTIDARANIHHWEIIPENLQVSLDAWSKQTGRAGEHSLEIEYLKGGKTDLTEPKHGKVDPDNQPHVGGNTWAGGSGGRDTAGMHPSFRFRLVVFYFNHAGLGGIGGPYRLDSGHQVYQVPDDVKAAVPEHVRKAARELGQKVFKERLKEIEMSEYEHDVYQKYLNKISGEIKMLRSIIESLEAKSHDRQWVRHRTTGDWDERKLIEGIIGEKAIYKYRADVPPEPGSPQTKAKRLRLVVDLSASMYRFNGVDNRLERQCECVLMFLESLAGFEQKFVYDIVGHSGDEHAIELVRKHQPPKNNKERLKLLKLMYTHTMFCSSGDNTLPALKTAIDVLQAEPDDMVDERFVIVISDANFDRYGLSPSKFGKMLNSNEKVQCFAMFIGSLGQQAIQLQQNLPSGKGFVCLETSEIPKVLKTIFTSDVLQ